MSQPHHAEQRHYLATSRRTLHPTRSPEMHWHLSAVRDPTAEEPLHIVAACMQMLWMSVLRFKHFQRSVPVKLTTHFFHAVCWKGKATPGFRWACPRWGPTGTDIGGTVWNAWTKCANRTT